MSAIARRCRFALSIAAASLAVHGGLPICARAQDLSNPERHRIEDMLRGVRKEIADHYYDSTYNGLNLPAAYDSANARIRDAHSLDAALAAVAWFTLDFHDSHTFFNPPPRTVGVEYGWEMAMVGDSCFVLRVKPGSDAERQGVHPGDQIVSIDGYAPTRDNLWQINYLYWVLRPQRRLHTVVRSPGSTPRKLDLASKVRERGKIMDLTGADGGRDIGQLVREGEREAEEYRPVVVEYGQQVLIWKLPTFEIPLDAVRDALKRARNRKALVLDLRGNVGGYEKTMLELIGRLNHDCVVVGKARERQKEAPIVAKGTGNDAFDGQLYVLVDSRSASASEILARVVQLTGRGRVLGDRTAGAVMRARYRPLRLGIETAVLYGVQVTEADVVMADGGRLERVGVTPDELILPTSRDLAARRDAVLARALTLAGAPTDAVRAGSIYPRKDH